MRRRLPVQCDFCAVIGRKEATVGTKRQRTENVHFYQQPFRKENCRTHNQKQHDTVWQEYQALPSSDTKVCFDRKSKNTMDGYSDKTRKRLKFRIDAPIVKDVIGGISFTLVG